MNKNLTHQISRAALTLLLMLTMSLTASASIAFITDVMVAGHNSQSQFTELIDTLQQQGWIDIEQDLNAGAGGDYIHLLLKTSSSAGSSGTAITGFYIKTGNNPPATLTHQGRTYYLVPYQGSTSFINSQGDLNRGAGGDYIHLYYTKDALSNHLAVSNIIFDNSQSGAIGANGGNTGYDLNSGCNFCNVHIFMHVTTAVQPFNQPQSDLDECTGGLGKIHVQGWTYDPDAPSESLDVEVYIYTDSDYSNLYIPAQLIHADVPRPDVNSYYNITGDHGFQADITVADAGDYWVKLHAIDHDGGTNPLIGSAAVTVTAVTLVTLTSESGVVLLHDGDTLTGTGGTETQVRIADGATVLFSDVNNTAIPNNSSHRWAGITCLGDAVIVLAEGTTNSVKGGKDNPGIYVPQNKTLTLQGSGTLNATGGGSGAGIGSGYQQCTVNASGGQRAAGIGGGRESSSCGNITISGGTVTATGAVNGASIGSGDQSSCGDITINGGTVTATGGQNAAGIGSGYNSSYGDITISGGTVTATGGQYAAGIGYGYKNAPSMPLAVNVLRASAAAVSPPPAATSPSVAAPSMPLAVNVLRASAAATIPLATTSPSVAASSRPLAVTMLRASAAATISLAATSPSAAASLRLPAVNGLRASAAATIPLAAPSPLPTV